MGIESGTQRHLPEVRVEEPVRNVRVQTRFALGPLEELVVYGAAVMLGGVAGIIVRLV